MGLEEAGTRQGGIGDDILSPVLGEVKAMIDAHFASLKDAIIQPVLDGNNEIRMMRSELESVYKTMLATRELTNSLALGSVAAMAPRKVLSPVVAAQLHSADMFLKPEVISAVSISSVAKYVTSLSSVASKEHILDVVRLLLFAPGAHSRKKARRTDLGRKFMELRLKIIRNMVFNCQVGVRREFINMLQPFLRLEEGGKSGSDPLDSSETGGVSPSGVPSSLEAARVQRIPFRPPAWTGKGFISRIDVDVAVGDILKHEIEESVTYGVDPVADGGLVQTQVAKKRKTNAIPKLSMREDISREIFKHMWKKWTDWFGSSRNEARKSFTLDLGVVFLEPNSRCRPMCSCNSVEDYYESIADLPLAEVSSVFRANYEATSSNLRWFKHMLQKYSKFVVTCQYTVEVFEGTEEMVQNQGAQEVTLRRSVHLLQAAANFLAAYFQVSSLEVLLGGSEHSFKLIFILALCFSDVISRASRPRVGSTNRDFVCSEAKDLGILIPGDTGRLNYITGKCLRMTRVSYEALNTEDSNCDGSVGDGASGGEIDSGDEDVENIFA